MPLRVTKSIKKTKVVNNVLVLLVLMLSTSCAPSQEAIQLSVQQTQTAMPTATATPCTDRGWADIQSYFSQFHEEQPKPGSNIPEFSAVLEGYEHKINSVEIDACSEHGRKTLIEAMDNYILLVQLVIGFADKEKVTAAMDSYSEKIFAAQTELAELKITFNSE